MHLKNTITVVGAHAEGEVGRVITSGVIAPHAVPTDNILRCCIRDAESDRQFLVVTEVKWCRPYNAGGDYLIGLSLFDSEGTDIVEWKEFIAQACAQQDE